VAEAALDEARYYVARGWGKVTPGPFSPPQAELDLTIATAFPPGFSLGASRYVGFSLVDTAGRSFLVNANTAGVLTVDTSTVGAGGPGPAAGRFLLVREGITGTWDDVAKQLTVADPVWAAATGMTPDVWRDWVVWDAATPPHAYPVTGSDVTVAGEVVLTVPSLPAAALGPFRLAYHPWLAALAAGNVPEGDIDGSNGAVWDRVFVDAAGNELGRAGVEALPVAGTTGSYTLTSRGGVGTRRHTVRLTVFRAATPTQGTGDWVIDDG
ncbi:MAG: hypothetical protein P1P84_05850, partial [Deferrisomatales bacterium]|nr:hypothetical protein [Deferrisomatales bacterium]